MMKGTRGMLPKKAASVEIGRKGSPVFARIVAWGACAWITALASGFALVPLALAAGAPGSEIQAPMAIVILFGLISSTALNMLVVPALYLRFGSVVSSRDAATVRPENENT